MNKPKGILLKPNRLSTNEIAELRKLLSEWCKQKGALIYNHEEKPKFIVLK